MLGNVERIWKESLDLIQDIFELFMLEIKLAGKSLVNIAVLLLVMVVLLLTTWFGLLGALIFWLVNMHFNLALLLVAASAINLLAAILVGVFVLKNTRNLQFPETRKQLGLNRGEDYELTAQD